MGLVIVQDIHSMCRKHVPGFLKNRKRSSLSSRSYGRSGIPGLVARSMLLVLLFLSFAWLSCLRAGDASAAAASAAESVDHFESEAAENSEILPFLLHDLEKEGLFRLGDKTLFVSDGDDELTVSGGSHITNRDEMFLVSAADQERQSAVPSETFNLAFTYARYHVSSVEFIDRTLRVGGILAVQFDPRDPPAGFSKPSNYETVYVRRFKFTILAMRKTGYAERVQNSFTARKLLDVTAEEARKRALSKLEDVLLEPPRASSRRSRTYLKRTRYLPDLMGDSLDLENYPRRLFLDVGTPERERGGVTEWFAENYPTRNLEFEMYKIETVSEDSSSSSAANLEIDSVPQRMGMSEWMKENVKEDEYVVMKAEAEVVEEMVRSKAIKLVDELFLECKPKGLGLGGRRSQSKNGRTYWECLALYGKLKDEGIAVHQWWG